MNRRTFLTSGAAACIATSGACTRKLSAQSSEPNVNLYNSSTAAHSIAIGNTFCASPSATDWLVIGNSLRAVLSDWQANNLDSQLVYGALTPDMITLSNLNQGQIIQSVQTFQPTFSADQLQYLLSPYASASPDMAATVIANLQAQGMAPYLEAAITEASTMYNSIASNPAGAARAASRLRGARSNFYEPFLPPPPDGSGYNCRKDEFYALMAGTAFLTLALMTGGIVPGLVVLSAGFWAPLASFGGTAVGVWGIGHAIFC